MTTSPMSAKLTRQTSLRRSESVRTRRMRRGRSLLERNRFASLEVARVGDLEGLARIGPNEHDLKILMVLTVAILAFGRGVLLGRTIHIAAERLEPEELVCLPVVHDEKVENRHLKKAVRNISIPVHGA